MKDRSDDPSHHEQTLLPRSYISLHNMCWVCRWIKHFCPSLHHERTLYNCTKCLWYSTIVMKQNICRKLLFNKPSKLLGISQGKHENNTALFNRLQEVVLTYPWCNGSLDWFLSVYPSNYFLFQPVLHGWYNKGHGMCYPLWDGAYKRTLTANQKE